MTLKKTSSSVGFDAETAATSIWALRNRTKASGMNWGPFGTVTLVVKDGEVFGMISKPNFTYQIRYIADGIHVVYEIDPSKFPPFSEPLVPNLKPGSSSLPGEDKMTKVEEATISSFLLRF